MRLINKFLKKGYLKIESRKDLSEDEKISQIIHRASAAGAVAVIQPFPFVDLLILTPILTFMAEKISSIRGERLKEKEAKKLVKKIWRLEVIGYWGSHIILGLFKIYFGYILIFFGYTSIVTFLFVLLIGYPVFCALILPSSVYPTIYATGKTADRYFLLKLKNQSLTAKDMKKEFKQFLKEGFQKAKEYRTDKAHIKRIKALFKGIHKKIKASFKRKRK